MLKKFVSSILAVFVMTGCASSSNAASTTAAASEETSAQAASETAATIVSDLNMENMTEVKQRTVYGLFLAGDKEISDDCAAYMSTENGNSNAVAVIVTDDIDGVTSYIDDYLDTQKAQTETYFPEEVFKISNAVVESNDSEVILIVADDIEAAKSEAEKILQ